MKRNVLVVHLLSRTVAKARLCVLLGLATGLVGTSSPVLARDPFDMANPSAGEMALLPDYCPYTIVYYRGGPDRELWQARLGPTLTHLHHYCWAILKVNRAKTGGYSAQLRYNLIASAVNEIQYVLNNGEPNFVLLPELLYRAGTFQMMNGELVPAMEFFERSRASKPNYWPPYVELANINQRLGRRDKALETLRAGLELMPNEPALLDALRRVEASAVTSRTGASAAGQ